MKGLYSPQYEHDACGVGTIAAGVAKAKADKILVSGCDGGSKADRIDFSRLFFVPEAPA